MADYLTVTGLGLVTGAMKLLGKLGAGETASGDDATDGLDRLNEFIDALGTHRQSMYSTSRTTKVLSNADADYTLGESGDIDLVRPQDIDRAAVIPVSQTQEQRVRLLTPAEWAAIPDKTLTADWPYALRLDPTAALATITVFPTPTSACTLALYTRTKITIIPTLATAVVLPYGYARMLRYNLARIMGPEWGVAVPGDVLQMAVDSLADVKRANTIVDDAPVDPAIAQLGGQGWYDITSGQVGG